MIQIYCYTCKAYAWKEWHDLNCPTHNTLKPGDSKMIEKFELDEPSNDTLIQQSKNCNGALYTRINKLQRDLNIANAEVEKFRRIVGVEHEHTCQYSRKLDSQRAQYNLEHEANILYRVKINDLEIKLKKIQEAVEAFKS